VTWFLEKFTKTDDLVVDIFGGSGSTLIACEKLQRKCRMMEIDCHYCDVIIKRYEDFTGKKAELINGKETG
jgi:DNA modification methylase